MLEVTNEQLLVQQMLKTLISEVLEKKWGTAIMQISVQNGKITSVRKSVEQTVQMRKS